MHLRNIKTEAKQDAYNDVRRLFFSGNFTQVEISEEAGVPTRTIRNWIKEGCWYRLRENANRAPAVLTENFINQLVEMQNYIARREPAYRFPTPKEAEIQCRLLNCIMRMNTYPVEMIQQFADNLRPVTDLVFEGDLPANAEEKQEALRAQFDAYEPHLDPLPPQAANEDQEIVQDYDYQDFESEYTEAESGQKAATRGNEEAESGNEEATINDDLDTRDYPQEEENEHTTTFIQLRPTSPADKDKQDQRIFDLIRFRSNYPR